MAQKELLIALFKKVIPPLDSNLHKGDCGRIGVIGGSFEYTGAPYYAAYSSLKSGADLSHVFCTKGAAIPIKSYSPELIVHPYLLSTEDESEEGKHENIAKKSASLIKDWFSRLNMLVIGPGLGRDDLVIQTVTKVIELAKEESLPIVIDADGLYLVTQNPDLIRNYSKCILTPNFNEYKRLSSKINCSSFDETCKELGVVIVRKGENDDISNGDWSFACEWKGSNRRCGGQGDLLTGSIATFYWWALKSLEDNKLDQRESNLAVAASCYAACALIRECSLRAFKKNRRGSTAEDLLSEIPYTFYDLFELPDAEKELRIDNDYIL